MTTESKKSWKCQACQCNLPKTDNTNTPIRPRDREIQGHSTENTNVTYRKKTNNTLSKDESIENISILGDTICNENNLTPDLQLNEQILCNLSEIIHKQLRENNLSIIQELKSTIQIEIQNAISKFKEDIKQDTIELFKQNDLRLKEIETINNKIKKITEEYEQLRNDISIIENKVVNTNTNSLPEVKNKKLVIYGLAEYYEENEFALHDRITEMFYEILHVDVTGYIEDAYRLGKKYNTNRPLVIELISSRMIKYLLENRQYFRGTGLHISEFLSLNEIKENKKMREEMFMARKNGYHAVIRNNQLYIEGKRVNKNYEILNRKSHAEENYQQVCDKNEQPNMEIGKHPNQTLSQPNRTFRHPNQTFRPHRTTF